MSDKEDLRAMVQNKFTPYIADHRDCVTFTLYNICVSPTPQAREKGKQIDRSEFEDARTINDDNIAIRKNEYRQQIRIE